MFTFLRDSRYPPLAIRAQLRWDVVRPIVQELAPETTIEVGVGFGAIATRIADMTSQKYVGFELDNLSYSQAKSEVEGVGGVLFNQQLGDVRPAPADLLCAFEVLEHIEDDHAALLEWSSYVRPGGHVLLSVPAHPNRFGSMDRRAGHFRRYSPEALGSLLAEIGMEDIEHHMYGNPLGYALEAVRNVIDTRRLAREGDQSLETRTAAGGRTFQFQTYSWRSDLAGIGTLPFRYLQRALPGGIGLVTTARKAVDG